MAEQETPKHRRPFQEFIPDEALEHMKAAREEMRKSMEALLPPGFLAHRLAARKEVLKAVRSVIEAALEKMEEKEEKKS